MPQVNFKKQSPKLDMNPMVDMAFLLVTFFMLTTTFKTEEPVEVISPSSISEVKLPEQDLMTITVSKEGAIFFTIDGQFSRGRLLDMVGTRYEMVFTKDERRNFALMSSFGIPISELKTFLNQEVKTRKSYVQKGIPCDSANNELADWIILSRVTNPRLRVALKGDQDTPYPIIKQVMNTLVDNKVNRFNLVTTLETSADG